MAAIMPHAFNATETGGKTPNLIYRNKFGKKHINVGIKTVTTPIFITGFFHILSNSALDTIRRILLQN